MKTPFSVALVLLLAGICASWSLWSPSTAATASTTEGPTLREILKNLTGQECDVRWYSDRGQLRLCFGEIWPSAKHSDRKILDMVGDDFVRLSSEGSDGIREEIYVHLQFLTVYVRSKKK